MPGHVNAGKNKNKYNVFFHADA